MLNLNHKKLDVWKEAVEFVVLIYEVTEKFPKNEIFGITNQLRRASVSISSNIAEGASRRSALERRRYFEMARGSLVEIDSQLIVSERLKFIEKEKLEKIDMEMVSIFSKIIQVNH